MEFPQTKLTNRCSCGWRLVFSREDLSFVIPSRAAERNLFSLALIGSGGFRVSAEETKSEIAEAIRI